LAAAFGLILTVLATSTLARAETLGLIAGPAAGTETMLAADMANAFTSDLGLRVLPMLGDAGAGNIELLLRDPAVDIAFVSTDALSYAEAKRGESLAGRLELVARLYPQEIHILGRPGIASLTDLAGRTVNFGPEGSGSAITAASLFKALGIEVERLTLGEPAAIERLKRGAISAAVVVGGKPMPLIRGLAAGSGLHFVPVPFSAALEAAYLPTELTHDDYPSLIADGGSVPAIATSMILVAAKSKGGGSGERVARFIETGFPRFSAFEPPDRHPKWREVNLAASWPGLTKAPEAEEWPMKFYGHPAGRIAPVLANSPSMSKAEKEALFRKFREWQRAKGH
jgi:TRAP transporter TAXI family solute receptor